MATIRERKTAKGSSFFVEIRLKGHPPMRKSFARKTDAKKWILIKEAGIREGRDFGTSESRNKTMADMVDRYLADILPTRKADQRDVERHLKWWKEQLGFYLLGDIKPAMIAELRDTLLNEETKRKANRTPATVVRYLASLSICYGFAVKEWGWVDENPVKKVRKPREPRGRLRFLSDDERKRLLIACKTRNKDNPFLYAVVVIALATGARQGEILKLRWRDIDFRRRMVVLDETKNNERRSIPLSKHAFELLNDMRKIRRIDSDYVFPGKGNRKYTCIRTAWDKAVEDAELTDFKFHDLRHTAASYLAMNGATLAEISAILGHKTLAMVKRYAHLTENHTAQVLERMNAQQFGS